MSGENGSSTSVRVRPKSARWLIVLAIAIVTFCYGWGFWGSTHELTSAHPIGYYGLLTDALTSGELHLKIEPDARLATLANPWAGAQGIPRVHDATYYHGHYYLYFGVTPVVILLAPWRILTGTFLAEALATTLFGWIGFLLSARLWRRIQKRMFPTLHPGWVSLGVLMIGLANYVYFLIETPVFYHVPIVCGFFCFTVALTLLDLGLESRLGEQSQVFFFAIASLSWALCVGARPNYVMGLTVLGLVAAAIALRMVGKQFSAGSVLKFLTAVFVPAAVVGAGLAWYNYARFGSVAEFGVKYQFASIDQRFLKLADVSHFWPTLKSYLTAGAYYTPYYPFIEERVDVIGILRWAPFSLLALFSPISAWRAFRERAVASSWMICVLLLVMLIHLASLSILPFANDRYLVDFVPEAILLALIVSADWLQRTRPYLGLHLLTALIIIAAAGDTFIHSNLLAIQRNSSPGLQEMLARRFDAFAPLWEKAFHTPTGRVEVTLNFDKTQPHQLEPIVSTDEGRDLVYVEYLDHGRVRFGFFHAGAGGPSSDPIMVEPGKLYHVSVDLGSLYPPAEHPSFAKWDQPTIDALHRRIEVRFEGQKILQWTSAFYDPNPFIIQIGKNTKSPQTARRFSGTIVSTHFAGLPTPDQVASVPGDGPIRLTVKFPPFSYIISQPLLSTGRPGAGDLIYVTYLAPNRIRFGHDSWGAGAIETVEVTYDPSTTHTVDIDMGSLYAKRQGGGSSTYKLKILFDGDYIISSYRPFHPSSPFDLSLGYDTTRSSAASPFFTGPNLTAVRVASLPDLTPAVTGWGPIRLIVSHLAPLKGAHEPLLVTGTPGAGDFIYMVYVDQTHIQIGYDHWGVGGIMSKPIQVDLSHNVAVSISTAALYPLAVAKEWDGIPDDVRKKLLSSTTVLVNGKPALDCAMTAYAASPNETYIGSNPIGGSSCNLTFTGSILTMQRMKIGTVLKAD